MFHSQYPHRFTTCNLEISLLHNRSTNLENFGFRTIQGSKSRDTVSASTRILDDRDLCALSIENNSPYAMVGGVVFGPDRRVTMAAMVTMFVLPMVSVDVSKRTEVTNNVRAASMRPKRRDRERRRCIFFMVFFFFFSWSVEQSNEGDSNSNRRVFLYEVCFMVFFFFGFEWSTYIYIYIQWLVGDGWWLAKKVVVECGVKKRTHRTDKRKSAQRKLHSSQALVRQNFENCCSVQGVSSYVIDHRMMTEIRREIVFRIFYVVS